MLARIEKLEGVLDAWTDRSGTKIVLSLGEKTATRDAIALVSSALAPRYKAEEVEGPEAAAAVSACQSGSPGWFRSKETIALSAEEARVVTGRTAKRVAEKADLGDSERGAFEERVRVALDGVLEEQRERPTLDFGGLVRAMNAALEKVVSDTDLPSGKKDRLRSALEEERGGK